MEIKKNTILSFFFSNTILIFLDFFRGSHSFPFLWSHYSSLLSNIKQMEIVLALLSSLSFTFLLFSQLSLEAMSIFFLVHLFLKFLFIFWSYAIVASVFGTKMMFNVNCYIFTIVLCFPLLFFRYHVYMYYMLLMSSLLCPKVSLNCSSNFTICYQFQLVSFFI